MPARHSGHFMTKNKQILAIYLFLAVITVSAFRQVVNHEFVYYDDGEYVTENRHIHKGVTIEGLRWAFTTRHAANWHPLTWISHMLDIQVFGLKPQGHHLTNLLFHTANVLLFFFVLHRMTKRLWQSAFVAALFALHPLHVESVAWVAERKDVLSTFFWMLTLVAYSYYAKRPNFKNCLVVIVLFALGLMAKPMLVTLPFVLLLLDYWPLDRFGGSSFKCGELNQQPAKTVQAIRKGEVIPVPVHKKKAKAGKGMPIETRVEMEEPAKLKFEWASARSLVLEKIPLFILTALSCVVTYIAQKEAGAVASIEVYTPDIRIANAFVSYFLYIVKTIWPDNLDVFYPHPGLLPLWQALGAAVFLAAITYAVVRAAKRFSYLPVGWLWFIGTLVPTIGIVQVGSQAMADRYMYIPSIGLFIMAAWGIPEFYKKRRYGREIVATSSALCLLCAFILTRTQVGYWRNSMALFDHALSITKNNVPIYSNRGNAFLLLGDRTRAIEDFNRAIEINPQFAAAYNGRGLAYNSMGDFTRALEDFDRAVKINPRFAAAYNGRGLAYSRMGNFSRALEDFDRAVEIDPSSAELYNNRGLAYCRMGKYSRAIEDFDRAIQVNSNMEAAYDNRGSAWEELGDHFRAVEDFNRAIEINPGDVDAYTNRGIIYNTMGNYIHAVEDFSRAIAINPRYARAYFNRGSAQGSLGNQMQSMEDLQTAAKFGSQDAGTFLKSQGITW